MGSAEEARVRASSGSKVLRSFDLTAAVEVEMAAAEVAVEEDRWRREEERKEAAIFLGWFLLGFGGLGFWSGIDFALGSF